MNGDTNTCLGICQPSQFSDYVSARPISTSRAVLRIPLGRSSRPHSEAVSRVSSTTTPRPPRTTFRPSTRLWTQSSNSATRSDLPSLLPTLGEPTLRLFVRTLTRLAPLEELSVVAVLTEALLLLEQLSEE